MKEDRLTSLEYRTVDMESDDYGQVLLLRHEALRRPIGLSILWDDLSRESENVILGAFDGKRLIATATLSPSDVSEDEAVFRYVVVDEAWQRKGVGSDVMRRLEEEARRLHKRRVRLKARIHVVPFYENLGYTTEGEPFYPEGVPVVHIWMTRDL